MAEIVAGEMHRCCYDANMHGRNFIFCLFTALFLLFALAAGFAVIEKKSPHPMAPSFITAHWRGLGIPGAPGWLGKKWTTITEDGLKSGGYWVFETRTEGYNPFKGYYSDGTLREEGVCFIEMMNEQPYHDSNNVLWSKCYRPDGTLGSEVIDGTGVQTIWYPDGSTQWQLELFEGERKRHVMYWPNGQLNSAQNYKNGQVHGSFTGYYQDGTKRVEGSYDNGNPHGTWTRYAEDGSVSSVEAY